jgi:hypothetical protein
MLGSNGRQPLHYGHAGSGGPARAHLAIITYVTTESGQDHHHHEGRFQVQIDQDYGLWIQVQTIDQDYAQQYCSLRTNQPTIANRQYFSLKTNQTKRTDRMFRLFWIIRSIQKKLI